MANPERAPDQFLKRTSKQGSNQKVLGTSVSVSGGQDGALSGLLRARGFHSQPFAGSLRRHLLAGRRGPFGTASLGRTAV